MDEFDDCSGESISEMEVSTGRYYKGLDRHWTKAKVSVADHLGMGDVSLWIENNGFSAGFTMRHGEAVHLAELLLRHAAKAAEFEVDEEENPL